jgi:hypothetical protein
MAITPSNFNWAALAGLASGNTVGEQFANVNNVLAAQQPLLQQQQEQNRTLNYLSQYHPEIAAQVKAGMPMANALKMVAEAQQPKKPNLMSVGDGLIYNADSGQWIKPPADMAQNRAKFGLNTIPGVDAQGNPVLLQVNDQGVATQTRIPEGVQIAKEPIKVDAGTHYILLDPITRQPISQIPKDISGVEREKAEGKVEGESKAALAAVKSTAQTIKEMIASVKNDPYRERGTGLSSILSSIPATGGYDFQRKVDQLKGQSFLQAIQQMQGFGALSNQEGATATAAISRLDTAQSEEAFNKALDDLEQIIDRGVKRVEAMSQGRTELEQPSNTDVNSLVEKYRTK